MTGAVQTIFKTIQEADDSSSTATGCALVIEAFLVDVGNVNVTNSFHFMEPGFLSADALHLSKRNTGGRLANTQPICSVCKK